MPSQWIAFCHEIATRSALKSPYIVIGNALLKAPLIITKKLRT